MNNFLKKEFKLCLAPINYVYLVFALMVFIPNYPRYVPFYFFGVSLMHIFNNALMNKDIEYSMILPITKKDIVKSRCILIAVYEIIFILLTIPFAIFYKKLNLPENAAGIEGNVAFYGIMLILVILFTFTFITSYYKKASKSGKPFLKATILFWVLFLLLETPFWIKNIINNPVVNFLDSTDAASQIKQLPILVLGIVVFVIGWILTYIISAKRFEKVDL